MRELEIPLSPTFSSRVCVCVCVRVCVLCKDGLVTQLFQTRLPDNSSADCSLGFLLLYL